MRFRVAVVPSIRSESTLSLATSRHRASRTAVCEVVNSHIERDMLTMVIAKVMSRGQKPTPSNGSLLAATHVRADRWKGTQLPKRLYSICTSRCHVRRATAPTPPWQLQGEYSLPSAVKQWSGTVYMLVALTAHEILLYVDAHGYSEGTTTQHSSKNLHPAKVAKLSPMCL